jgi:YidC/Oxa1 family membrane protein insertase
VEFSDYMFDAIILKPIFNLLFALYSFIPGGDFGVAIIIFTIIVRLLMWPLVKKQMHQAKAMRKLQPEMAKIKAQAKGNKQMESMLMMELYKKHGVSPFSSIGVLIIQLPIFIALFSVIRIFTLQRDQIASFTYEFLKGVGPVKDLIANPDSFNNFFLGFLDLTKVASFSSPKLQDLFLLLLALGAAFTQYVMAKQTMPQQKSQKKLRDLLSETADGKQANQAEMSAAMMGKMAKFMPIMMFFIMIRMYGAIALYYTVSNLVAVIQQRHILKGDVEEMEEIADKMMPVDEKPKSGKKATAKARAKLSKEATIVKITAKDTSRKSK